MWSVWHRAARWRKGHLSLILTGMPCRELIGPLPHAHSAVQGGAFCDSPEDALRTIGGALPGGQLKGGYEEQVQVLVSEESPEESIGQRVCVAVAVGC